MKKSLLIIFLIVIGLGIGMCLVLKPARPRLPLVRTTKIEQGALIASLLTKGVVTPEQKSVVCAQANGRIKEVQVEQYQRVEANQKILIFDEAEAQSSIARTELNLESAKKELEQAERLFFKTLSLSGETAATKTQMEDDQAWYKNALVAKKIAEKELKLAQTHLQNLDYYAPQAGVVIEKRVEANQFVNANDPLLTVADLSKMVVPFNISGQEALLIKLGQEAIITKYGLKKKFKGYIKEILPKTEYTQPYISGTITLAQQLPELALNNAVKITVITRKKDNALLLPSETICKQGNQRYVFLYQEGVVTKRVVRVGVSNNKQTEIIFGLGTTDEVVFPTDINLEAGMKVTKK